MLSIVKPLLTTARRRSGEVALMLRDRDRE
jgi:hypothetical protein